MQIFNLDNIKLDLNRLFLKKRFYATIFSVILSLLTYRYGDKIVIQKTPAKKEKLLIDMINHRLEEIRERHNCDYVAINIFKISHITGTEQMDRKYEAAAQGKIPLAPLVKNYECNVFERSFKHLKLRGHIYINDTKTYKKDTYLANTLYSLGTRSVFYVGLYDLEARIYKMEDGCVGFVSYEFDRPTKFTEAELNDLIIETDLIVPYILKLNGINN